MTPQTMASHVGAEGLEPDDLHRVIAASLVLDRFSCGVDVRLVPEVIGVEWSRVVAKVLRGFVSRVRDVAPMRGDRVKTIRPRR